MKFSEKWLREWIDPQIGSEELAEQLTMLGLEVDSVERLGTLFEGVIVGHVQSVSPHPDADRLRVCQVDDGKSVTQVVCGAPNVSEGMKTAFATVGARLPSGMKIKKTKLRGVESAGMLCSESELGLSEASDGLMVLPDDAPAGVALGDYLKLQDTIIDIDITPNRGDCFCIRGVARDLSARNEIPLARTITQTIEPTIADTLPVTVEPDNACVVYTGRVIDGVDNSVQSPLWLVERLRRSGVRAISPVVDVTNYVMLEIGQPMHAFDLTKVAGGIIVRHAGQGEKLVLLDGREVALDQDTTVIADQSGAIGIAGIMGGDSTGCDEKSQRIFLESALFLPEHIVGKSRRYAVHTESGHRFERGVDPRLQQEALDYATQLILDICGGQAGEISEFSEAARLPLAEPFVLRRARIKRLLGIEVADTDVESCLGKLGVQLDKREDGWLARAPGYRYDLRIEADLIEEIARVYGYHKLPRTFPDLSPEFRTVKDHPAGLETAREYLVDRGYQEVVTYSFVDHELQEKLFPEGNALPLSNPISSDLSVMRVSLWPGLVATLQKNLNRQVSDVRLFESGLRFVQSAAGLQQERVLGGLISGRLVQENWTGSDRQADFFDLKGDLEGLFERLHVDDLFFQAAQHPALHPGQSATILQADRVVGWIGTLHPNLQKSLDLSQTAIIFEIDLKLLETAFLPAYQEISKFPAVRRDIAIVLDDAIPMRSVEQAVLQSGVEYLKKVVVFDVYRGDKIAKELKSVALGLILQDNSRTLGENEVEKSVAGIIKVLEEKLGATLRM
ncbi:MAG: phenylalanine--tRNA ligase subunit beta [Gammaproteobacteria bacterium]|nr:phenylalanine--tRNA ligase subunit beta [Gammaproteobacteria bacterium]